MTRDLEAFLRQLALIAAAFYAATVAAVELAWQLLRARPDTQPFD